MPYNELYELIYGNLEGTDTEEKLEKRLKQEGVNCEVQDERSAADIVEGYEAGFPSFHYSHLYLAGIIGFLAGITIGNIARFRNLYKRNEDKENSENQ